MLGKVFTGAKGLREPQTKETLVNFLIHFSRSVEIGASRIPREVRETNNRLNQLIELFQNIDTLHLPNQLRKQEMWAILGSKEIYKPEDYDAWEDNRLSLEDKIMIANGLEKEFKTVTDAAVLNYFYIRENIDNGPALIGTIPQIKLPKGVHRTIDKLKVELRTGLGKKVTNLRQNLSKESFKNGIQGLKEALQSIGKKMKVGPELAAAGADMDIIENRVTKPMKKTGTQENYLNVMESSSGKAPQGKGGAEGTGNVEDKLKLSDKARELMQKGHYSQAMDRHYEDMVRKKTGGKEVIYGEKGRERELDSVTKDAVIETKRSMSAVTKPDNFMNKKMKQQLKATIQYAEEHGLKVEYWFKYGVHPKISKYLQEKGVIVKTGMGD